MKLFALQVDPYKDIGSRQIGERAGHEMSP